MGGRSFRILVLAYGTLFPYIYTHILSRSRVISKKLLIKCYFHFPQVWTKNVRIHLHHELNTINQIIPEWYDWTKKNVWTKNPVLQKRIKKGPLKRGEMTSEYRLIFGIEHEVCDLIDYVWTLLVYQSLVLEYKYVCVFRGRFPLTLTLPNK